MRYPYTSRKTLYDRVTFLAQLFGPLTVSVWVGGIDRRVSVEIFDVTA